MNTVISRALLLAGAAAGCAVLATGTAAAHVTATAPGASQGGYGYITFRVPTESNTATTTKLRVQLPALSSARTEPLPGWTATLDKNDKNQITAVTWTANPGNPGIGATEFEQFVVAAGPLPTQESVSLPASQTYSDGKVVDWNQPMGAGGAEPEHPAPMISLTAKTGDAHGMGGDPDGDSDRPGMKTMNYAKDSDSDDTARWLGGIGLVLGALGAALGLASVIRSRRS